MSNINKVCLFCLILLTFSCVVGPEYKKPEVSPPEHFVSQEVFKRLNDDSETIPLDTKDDITENWWQGFTDPLLTEFVEIALKQNFIIAQDTARLKQALHRVRLIDSRDEILTEVTLDTAIQQDNVIGGDDTSATGGEFFGSFFLTWPLDIFGRTQRELEAARAEVEQTNAELRGTVLSVSASVTREYLRLRGNQRQLLLLEESVALQEKTLAIVDSRYRAGLAPELDLRRAEAAVANLKADIPELKEQLINSRNALATLTGHYPGKYEEALSDVQEIPTYKGNIPNLIPIEVISLRPEVQSAEANLKQAIAEVGVAETEWYPEFALAQQISIGASGVSSEPTVGIFLASISALIQQIVTDSGAREAELNIALAQAEELLAFYRQTLLDAVEEVETTLAALQSSLERQESLAKAVEASDRSFFQAESLYRQGLTSFLDVVDAQRVLAAAQQQLAAAKTNYAVQIANLFRVLGTEINT